jgi:orotate phosphoribosyltransferase
MESYKQDFIEFMVRSNVLTFGDFTTKSGRKTPFFINTGNYRTGAQMHKLGEYYAAAIHSHFQADFNVLFGPAYKGIPLVITASMALASKFGHDVAFCFNRKETKDHGEGGSLIGHKLKDGDRVIIIEDVITAGTSIRESIPLLMTAANVTVVGLIVSVNRMERGQGTKAALDEIEDEFKIPAKSIVSIEEIVEYLHNRLIDGKVIIDDSMKEKIDAYRKQYGV